MPAPGCGAPAAPVFPEPAPTAAPTLLGCLRQSQRMTARSVRRRSLDAGRLARDRRRGGVLARVWTSGRPDSGMEVPHGKAGTQEIRVSYALDGPARAEPVRWRTRTCLSARPHPLDVARAPSPSRQGVSSESEHFLDPPVRRREPLALRVPGLAREARQLLTQWRAGPGRATRDALTPQRAACRGSPAPADPALQ